MVGDDDAVNAEVHDLAALVGPHDALDQQRALPRAANEFDISPRRGPTGDDQRGLDQPLSLTLTLIIAAILAAFAAMTLRRRQAGRTEARLLSDE